MLALSFTDACFKMEVVPGLMSLVHNLTFLLKSPRGCLGAPRASGTGVILFWRSMSLSASLSDPRMSATGQGTDGHSPYGGFPFTTSGTRHE